MKISIGKAAKLLGVSMETLRRWEKIGKIQSERTAQGHRRYDQNALLGLIPKKIISNKKTIAYARVSSHDQKKDLDTQACLLEAYCAAHGWSHEVILDLGSGLNYSKKGLKKLIRSICSHGVERLVLTHKDRLLRFGSDLVFSLCEEFGVEVIIMNAAEERSFEDDLAQDVLEILTVFSARLYGKRSPKNQTLLEKLKDAAESL